MQESVKIISPFSHELGNKFTWENPDQPNQKGWRLNPEIRTMVADGAIKNFILVLDANIVKTDGGIGGIEVSINSLSTGFCMDFKSFPWNWDIDTQAGGYTSYSDLLSCGYATLGSGLINLKYDITSHPNFSAFKSEMSTATWGEISIQYGIGIRILPFVNAYLQS
ncbi:MAG: hypothetical protein FWD22_01595 [Treponema sp.]|nr:hypothetical protein [Treponema sp.]